MCTIGDYRVATGGVDTSACFKSLTGELILSAIVGNQGHDNGIMPVAEVKKRTKEQDIRTENTLRGSEALSAEIRFTKRTRRDQLEEKENKIKALKKNIQMGNAVMKSILDLKHAERTLTQMNVSVENLYWEINDQVVQEKLKIFLRLWFFPLGGGKLSKTKSEQLTSLRTFNLTKEGVDAQIEKSKEQLLIWKQELEELNEQSEEELDNDDGGDV